LTSATVDLSGHRAAGERLEQRGSVDHLSGSLTAAAWCSPATTLGAPTTAPRAFAGTTNLIENSAPDAIGLFKAPPRLCSPRGSVTAGMVTGGAPSIRRRNRDRRRRPGRRSLVTADGTTQRRVERLGARSRQAPSTSRDHQRVRRWTVAAALGGNPRLARQQAAPPAAAPAQPVLVTRTSPLVVAIVVDQLAQWQAVERWKSLPRDGGFAKLVAEAGATAELRHGHAYKATGPGHAPLFTGGTGHDSGITTNGGFDNGKAELVH
jgi:hypothetical protein